MSTRSKIVMAVLASVLSCAAHAGEDRAYEDWLIRVGDYETLYRSWWHQAFLGDAAMQERAAELALGPHGREAKVGPHDGIHFLFRAAVNGRPKAMLRLADAIDKGAFGLQPLPAAVRCWSRPPAGFEQRLACVRLTGFSDPQARVPCTELVLVGVQERLGRRNGAPMAKLCLANRTPAILAPGLPPPGQQDLEREYARHGIEWSFTGCVSSNAFEEFRAAFNRTVAAGIDSERGKGYLKRLTADIDVRVSRFTGTR